MVWTYLVALKYDVGYCEDIGDYSAIAWLVVGWFKDHDNISGCDMIPFAVRTNSGIEMFLWTQGFLIHMGLLGYDDGWAFC